MKGFVIAKSKGGPDPILDMCWPDNDHFATCGTKNYGYWDVSKKGLKKFKKPSNGIKRGHDNLLLCCYYGAKSGLIIGTQKGDLQFYGEKIRKSEKKLHWVKNKKGKKIGKPIDAIWSNETKYTI